MIVYLQMIDSAEDRSKFERIYRRYRRLMFYVAYRLLQNEQDAEDAVHQAFLSILEHLKKISDPYCPKTQSFVVITVERKAIDMLRRRGRAAAVPLDETEHGVFIPPPGDHGLADAMARLPARYRAALLLRYDNGYSTREVAQILGLKYDAAQKLIYRAKQALQAYLNEEDEA